MRRYLAILAAAAVAAGVATGAEARLKVDGVFVAN